MGFISTTTDHRIAKRFSGNSMLEIEVQGNDDFLNSLAEIGLLSHNSME